MNKLRKTKIVNMLSKLFKKNKPHTHGVILTGQEIRELAEFTGFTLHEPTPQYYEDIIETEISIDPCPKAGVKIEQPSGAYEIKHYPHIAYCYEYPEEGCVPLGEEIKPVINKLLQL